MQATTTSAKWRRRRSASSSIRTCAHIHLHPTFFADVGAVQTERRGGRLVPPNRHMYSTAQERRALYATAPSEYPRYALGPGNTSRGDGPEGVAVSLPRLRIR